MKFFSKIQIFGVALATLMAFGFTGCDEVKSLAASVSIEEPLVTIEYDSREGKPYLRVQSQDNDTIIEDAIINRGNCETFKYRRDLDKWFAYKGALPKARLNTNSDWNKIRTQSGELVQADELVTMDFYNTLDDESKAIYDALYPKKLPYGKTIGVRSSCNANSIIEVELVVNGGGRLTYNFK